MHPILDVLDKKILAAKDLDVYRHIGAANFSGNIYGEKNLRRMWSMTPFSQVYFSLANPLFTSLFSDLKQKNLKYPIVMIRDGAIDLIQYMIENPKPPTEFEGYLIDERLEPFVSDAWHECGLFYRLYHEPATAYRSKTKATRLIVSSIANGSFVSPRKFESDLNLAKEFSKKNNLQIQVHMPVRENVFFDKNYRDEPALFEAGQLIYKILGNDVTFISDKKITAESDFRDAYYLISTNGAICLSDNTLEHQLLSKGASPVLAHRDVSKDCLKFPLSSHHGIAINYKKREKGCGELFLQLIEDAIEIKEASSINLKKHQFAYHAAQLTYGDFFHYLRENYFP